MELLVGLGLFYMGYKVRQQTAKEQPQNEVLAQKETALVEAKQELEATKKEFIELKLKFTKTQVMAGAISIGLVGVACLAYVAVQRQKAAEERAEKVLNMDNMWQCVVCEDNEKTVVYLPCNHLAVCNECDDAMAQMNADENAEGQSCPICRADIQRRVTVHL